MSLTTPSAAALARRFLDIVSSQDESAIDEVFDPVEGRLEMAYPLDGVSGDAMVIKGRQIAGFQRNAFAVTEKVVFHDFGVDELSDELAFVRYKSTATFRDGTRYANTYCVRVEARGGRIVHWLEYFDPRPAELFSAAMAGEVARQRTAGR